MVVSLEKKLSFKKTVKHICLVIHESFLLGIFFGPKSFLLHTYSQNFIPLVTSFFQRMLGGNTEITISYILKNTEITEKLK